jgi:hypothetical protein
MTVKMVLHDSVLVLFFSASLWVLGVSVVELISEDTHHRDTEKSRRHRERQIVVNDNRISC